MGEETGWKMIVLGHSVGFAVLNMPAPQSMQVSMPKDCKCSSRLLRAWMWLGVFRCFIAQPFCEMEIPWQKCPVYQPNCSLCISCLKLVKDRSEKLTTSFKKPSQHTKKAIIHPSPSQPSPKARCNLISFTTQFSRFRLLSSRWLKLTVTRCCASEWLGPTTVPSTPSRTTT